MKFLTRSIQRVCRLVINASDAHTAALQHNNCKSLALKLELRNNAAAIADTLRILNAQYAKSSTSDQQPLEDH
jgi:hypothetical protein